MLNYNLVRSVQKLDEIKIGIMGEFRSGKSTVAEYLEKRYGFTPFAFATELKNAFHKQFPHIQATPKPREGYQIFGDLMRYVYGEDYFVETTLKEIKRMKEKGVSLGYIGTVKDIFLPMVTDVRFPNEWKRLKKEGYIIIKVTAPEELRMLRAEEAGDEFSLNALNHDSEKHIKDAYCDYEIMNDGSLEDLYRKVDTVMKRLEQF